MKRNGEMKEWKQSQEKSWKGPGTMRGTFLQTGNLSGCGITGLIISGIIGIQRAITDTLARGGKERSPMGNSCFGKMKPAGRLPGAFTRNGRQNGRWYKKWASSSGGCPKI